VKLSYDDIINKHKNTPCVVALHGPSLDQHKEKIEDLQKEQETLRISVNEWYDFFNERPDYWIVSNGEFTIDASINGSHIWTQREYPQDVFNKYGIPLFYNAAADLTDEEVIEQHLKCDYLSYDTKHFCGDTCIEIFKNFKSYYEENKNLDFTHYGNNPKMWRHPNVDGFDAYMKLLHGRFAPGWDLHGKCCKGRNINTPTVQERLQQFTNYSQHAGPGQTVGLFAITFAILMGCNPIYVTGLDLDCTVGYANSSGAQFSYNSGHMGHWKVIFRDFLLDDMRIIKESAENIGVKIINLNKGSWHNVFEKGELFA